MRIRVDHTINSRASSLEPPRHLFRGPINLRETLKMTMELEFSEPREKHSFIFVHLSEVGRFGI